MAETYQEKRYPAVFYSHDRNGRMGVAAYVGRPWVSLITLLENKPGGAWREVEMTPDEAELFAHHILQKVAAVRETLAQSEG